MRKIGFWSISRRSLAGRILNGVPLKRLGVTLSCRHRYCVSWKLPPPLRLQRAAACPRCAHKSNRWMHQYSAQRRPDKQWLAYQVKMPDSQSAPVAPVSNALLRRVQMSTDGMCRINLLFTLPRSAQALHSSLLHPGSSSSSFWTYHLSLENNTI